MERQRLPPSSIGCPALDRTHPISVPDTGGSVYHYIASKGLVSEESFEYRIRSQRDHVYTPFSNPAGPAAVAPRAPTDLTAAPLQDAYGANLS